MKGKFLYQIGLWLPVFLWAALIFHFSSGKVFVASTVYWQDFTVKKIGHVLLFGFLAVLIFRALRGSGMSRKKAAIWAILLAFFYGGTDEYHQMFTQGRESRIRDVFIDGLGAAAFILVVYQLFPKADKESKKLFEKLNLI